MSWKSLGLSVVMTVSSLAAQNAPSKYFESTKLAPSDGMDHDLFGHAVAIDGDTIVVGSREGPR